MDTENAIVNFSKGQWYPRGQARLARTLDEVGFTGHRAFYVDEAELGCPSHAEAPYAFKAAALIEASKKSRYVLWVDSAAWAHRNPGPVFSTIARRGHLFQMTAWTGNWTNDKTLEYFGVSRDEAMTIPMIMACVIGLDTQRQECREFLRQWDRLARTTDLFRGAWQNDQKTESQDFRCYGHRHDQSVASLLLHKMECFTIEARIPAGGIPACTFPAYPRMVPIYREHYVYDFEDIREDEKGEFLARGM